MQQSFAKLHAKGNLPTARTASTAGWRTSWLIPQIAQFPMCDGDRKGGVWPLFTIFILCYIRCAIVGDDKHDVVLVSQELLDSRSKELQAGGSWASLWAAGKHQLQLAEGFHG